MPLPERTLISGIRSQAKTGLPHPSRFSKGAVIAGIGDDCAILRIPVNHQMLVTTDFSLEGVHFRREWHPPQSVGHRCLARGLSDIAAMGGEPVAAFLSLAVPPKLPQRWVDRFLKGLLGLANEFKVTLAGGDTSESPNGILADIVVVGSVPKAAAILRSGARPGDRIYVTGELGASAATLDLLRSQPKKELRPKDFSSHFFPIPRIRVGRTLRQRRLASSMIDISDGLSSDLTHICEESWVGAEIRENAVPRASIGNPAREVGPKAALHDGEDYELLFTSSKPIPSRIAGVLITDIGSITRKKGIALVGSSGPQKLRPGGWEHFRS